MDPVIQASLNQGKVPKPSAEDRFLVPPARS